MREKREVRCADAARAVDFLTREQLTDAPLWKKFVDQFRLQPDGEDYGWRGEFWGKMMRGAATVYAYSRNEELYGEMRRTVEDMMGVADDDGRVSSYTRETEFDAWDIWCRKYVLLGMLYFYDVCPEQTLRGRILSFVKGAADAILRGIGEGEGQIPITRASRSWFGVNSSSVLEPMVWLYRLTGEGRYLDFASYIVQKGGAEGINIFSLAEEDRVPLHAWGVSKAYEMMSCFEGLLAYYEATGIEKYRRAVECFGRRILEEELSVIGSSGCTHELFDYTRYRQTADYDGVMQETCVTVTWMKLAMRLYRLTGELAYADAVETAFYNAYLGALNTEHKHSSYIKEKYIDKQGEPYVLDSFLPFDSYSPLRAGVRGAKVGGNRLLSDKSYYGCCACIGACGVGTFLDMATSFGDDVLTVLFFEEGEGRYRSPYGDVTLVTQTLYPKSGDVTFRVGVETARPLTLRIRVPAWSRTVGVDARRPYRREGGFLILDGVWEGNEEVRVAFDMSLRAIRPLSWQTETVYTAPLSLEEGWHAAGPLTVSHRAEDDLFVALASGPLVLAADERLGRDPDGVFDFVLEDGVPVGEGTKEESFAGGVPCRVKWRLPLKDGTHAELVDYASVGRDWESRIAAWLRVKSK